MYFLTATGKAFYDQLMEQQYVAISATKDKIAVSLRGKIKNSGKKNLDIMIEKNPYMKKIYLHRQSTTSIGAAVPHGRG